MARIAKLKPGSRRRLQAVRTENQQVTTDPKEIAAELKKHWARTFQNATVDECALAACLEVLKKSPVFVPVEQNESRE